MGANAQTSVPTFTAGEVLTAANMNISARTGVPVFADTTARDAAFGGTGEKTLAEGQMAYVENLTGDAQIQYYDGSTWNSLGAAGLTLISSTTIGSAVSSVTVSNAFSSTYDNYLITVSGGAASTDMNINMTLGATATGYYKFGYYGAYNSSTVNGANGNNSTSWVGVASGATNGLYGWCHLSDPFASDRTSFSSMTANQSTTGTAAQQSGFLDNATSYTAFTLTTSTGTMTGGTVRVYGYRN